MTDAVSVVRPAAAAATTMREALLPADERRLDTESQAWFDALSANGREHEDAVARLHELLTRAARFEIARRRRALAGSRPGDLEDLATQAASDALMAILRKLHTYRGESRFTTWAYKFALYQASVKVRRRSWQGREIPVADDAWNVLASADALPEDEAEQSEVLGAIRDGIATALTPHQRTVLVALALNDVPIDVLADRLQTTRGALYKTLHDARRALRRHLADAGHAVGEQRR